MSLYVILCVCLCDEVDDGFCGIVRFASFQSVSHSFDNNNLVCVALPILSPFVRTHKNSHS